MSQMRIGHSFAVGAAAGLAAIGAPVVGLSALGAGTAIAVGALVGTGLSNRAQQQRRPSAKTQRAAVRKVERVGHRNTPDRVGAAMARKAASPNVNVVGKALAKRKKRKSAVPR